MPSPDIALLTQHGKQHQIQPGINQLGWNLIHTQGYDTDKLGTFSGEVARQLSPLECAQKKAEIACSLTQAEYGLGSEGSFSPSSFGFGTANLEIIACVNRSGKLMAIGYHEALVMVDSITLTSAADDALEMYLNNLPEKQASIIMVAGTPLAKGVCDKQRIASCLTSLPEHAFKQGVEVSYDLRAHLCPERQKNISAATNDLTKKLNAHCPQCGEIGFWPEHIEAGLLCQWCHQPTKVTKAHIAKCNHCGFHQYQPVEEEFANPQYCHYCNP